jgi:hypothetical protein
MVLNRARKHTNCIRARLRLAEALELQTTEAWTTFRALSHPLLVSVPILELAVVRAPPQERLREHLQI